FYLLIVLGVPAKNFLDRRVKLSGALVSLTHSEPLCCSAFGGVSYSDDRSLPATEDAKSNL
ncbi:MAG: hypothetical protein OEM26_21610, partial [Saprospiraceae bacterium]|nr:hypothetical protein [Saprospiraceae bacterium]